MSNSAATTRPSPSLPLFYKDPVALSGDEHRRHGMARKPNFGFAAESTAIPISIAEFATAQRHFPIVFTDDEFSVPVAVTGIVGGRNLFTEADGGWRSGQYIPGYVRRYPFILSQTPESGEAILLIDKASSRFVSTDDDANAIRFFDDEGAATAAAQEAVRFCQTAYLEQTRTTAFVQALHEHNLLVSNQANVRFSNGATYTVNGFKIVDESAFRALPADVLSHWLQQGWLDCVSFHLASTQNWQSLIEIHEQTQPPLSPVR
ncbi:MAG: SapC family protein [Rhizobiaceae bacterium]|nr:SapC family protein [Rhizobiaceae bacterium]